MESIELTSKIWSRQNIILRNGSIKYTHERPNTQHLLIKNRVYDIYSLQMDFISITHGRWSTYNLLVRIGIGVHTSYTLEIVHTTFNLERWSTHPILMRDGDYSIYS